MLNVTVGPEDIITCSFANRMLVADINVDKAASAATVVPGSTVTYTYEVTTGTGEVALSNVVLTDVKCPPLREVASDTNGNSILDPGETWTYTCSAILTEDTLNTGSRRPAPPRPTKVTPSPTRSR